MLQFPTWVSEPPQKTGNGSGQIVEPISPSLFCLHLSFLPIKVRQTKANYKPSFPLAKLITRSWVLKDWNANSYTILLYTLQEETPWRTSGPSELYTDKETSDMNTGQRLDGTDLYNCSPKSCEVKHELKGAVSRDLQQRSRDLKIVAMGI